MTTGIIETDIQTARILYFSLMEATCRLCLQQKHLIKKSHIIPDFMYAGIFDTRHRSLEININDLTKTKNLLDGYYDRHILCADCDNRVLGSLETYASQTLFLKSHMPNRHNIDVQKLHIKKDELPCYRISNIDYTKIKLFLLSILWRSHISSQSIFNIINLGPYAEKIRKMILLNDAGPDNELESCIVILPFDGIAPTKTVIEPRKLKTEGNCFYVFHINEVMIHYNISEFNKQSIFDKGAITRNNTMNIAILTGQVAHEYFDSFLGKKFRLRNKTLMPN